MSGMSNYLVNSLIDQVLRGQAAVMPGTQYVGLTIANEGIWATATTYAAAAYVAAFTTDGTYHLYYTLGGGTGAGTPTFTGSPGEMVVDGTILWTEQTLVMKSGAAVNEPTIGTGGYARVPIVSSLADWAGTQGPGTTAASTGTSGATSNNNDTMFPVPTLAWATAPAAVWGIVLYDAPIGGNLLVWGPIGLPVAIGTGAAPDIVPGQLHINLAYPSYNPPPPPDGTLAIFHPGTGATHSLQYIFLSNVLSNSTNISATGGNGLAVGNSTKGVFVIGNVSTTTFEYTYSGTSVASGTALTANSRGGMAAGTTTFGIMALGNTTTTTDKYTYSGSTVASSTVLSNNANFGAAAGNATIGLFCLGFPFPTTTNKFTYSGATVGSGTSLPSPGLNTGGGSATGNNTVAIINQGTAVTNWSYTYSGDVVAASTSLTNISGATVAAGNSIEGLFCNISSGLGNNSNVFTYSGATVAYGTNMGQSVVEGVSNGINGITI